MTADESDVTTSLGIELDRDDDPAVVRLDDGLTEIVADHQVIDSGWLCVQDREGTIRKYPPSMVREVRPVETTVVTGEGGQNVYKLVLSGPETDFLNAVMGGGLDEAV